MLPGGRLPDAVPVVLLQDVLVELLVDDRAVGVDGEPESVLPVIVGIDPEPEPVGLDELVPAGQAAGDGIRAAVIACSGHEQPVLTVSDQHLGLLRGFCSLDGVALYQIGEPLSLPNSLIQASVENDFFLDPYGLHLRRIDAPVFGRRGQRKTEQKDDEQTEFTPHRNLCDSEMRGPVKWIELYGYLALGCFFVLTTHETVWHGISFTQGLQTKNEKQQKQSICPAEKLISEAVLRDKKSPWRGVSIARKKES